ncbi:MULTISPECIES: DUF4870 domain-containing protein [Archaeoglobus]|jgi:uncharacterized membrane protein|nr:MULTISPECIES: DUF4870 domain-containing protein [Archaeoglobus]AIG97611.1 putative membrane protein [Archaeoglobus fulgidus DSM 8774]KUJ93506.1 MAG: UPF0132 membrane protein [Archaeoglobus fulgidus]KUK07105.1 MAG: hypothetical protein XD48_0644 [Archaeoglobus fulgidus]MDI3496836.1 hypothetical protein [Archaeoglobus sp.]
MEVINENIRAAMCYTLGFVTGVLFLLFDRSPFVRFHAVQSTLTFSTITALVILLPVLPGGALLSRVVMAFSIILWAFCIVKASRGEAFKLPIFGDIAEEQLSLNYT